MEGGRAVQLPRRAFLTNRLLFNVTATSSVELSRSIQLFHVFLSVAYEIERVINQDGIAGHRKTAEKSIEVQRSTEPHPAYPTGHQSSRFH